MAKFTEEIPDQGLFKGGPSTRDTGNQSFGQLFADVGTIIGKSAQVADQAIQGRIKTDIQNQVESVQNEFGVGAASTINSSVFPTNENPTPEDIQMAGSKISDLREAVRQGRLSQTHYFARLDSIVRQTKSRFPGFRDQIDTIVRDVTGITPANSLQSALIQDAEEEARKQQGASDKNFAFVLQNSQFLPPGALNQVQTGERSVFWAMDFIQRNRATQQQSETQRARLSLLNDNNQLTNTEAEKSVRGEISDLVNQTFTNTSSVLGMQFSQLQGVIKKAGVDKEFNSAEVADIRSRFAVLKNNVLSQAQAVLSQPWSDGGPSYSTVLSKTQRDDVIGIASERLDIIESALVDKNFGILLTNSALVESQKNDATLNVFNSKGGGVLKSVQALSDIAGPQFTGTVLASNPDVLDATLTAIRNGALADMGVTGEALSDTVTMLRATGQTDSRLFKSVIDGAVRGLTDPNITDEGFENFAKSAFNNEVSSIFANFKRNERLALFNRLTSPSITVRMNEVGKRKPELLEQYRGWAAGQFTSLFREQANNIVFSSLDPKFVQISFNRDKGLLEVKSTNRLGDRFGAIARSEQGIAQRLVTDMNGSLNNLRGILGDEGLPDIEALVRAMGLPSTGKGTETKPGNRATSGTQRSETSVDTSFDTLAAAVIQQESGGNQNAVSSRGAKGVFQVTDATNIDPGFGVEPAKDNSLDERDRVGKDFLQAMLDNFGDNHVLALAAFNAGPSTVNKWIKRFGDPRKGEISDQEFADAIPFKETRDYVATILGNVDPR